MWPPGSPPPSQTAPDPPSRSPFNLDQGDGVVGGGGGLRTSCIEMFNLAEGEVCIATHHPGCSLFVRASWRRERWWVWVRGGSCGNHGNGLYCIIPHHWAPGDRGCPHHLERVVLPRQNTLTYSWWAPPQIDVTKDGGALFVASDFVRTAGFLSRPEPKKKKNETNAM